MADWQAPLSHTLSSEIALTQVDKVLDQVWDKVLEKRVLGQALAVASESWPQTVYSANGSGG